MSTNGTEYTGQMKLKTGLAEMLKGGVIMDVTDADQAKIAEDAGAVSVMALERVPASRSLTLRFDEAVFVNSSGLAVLMDLLLPIKDRGITLAHPKPHFRRVFEITGMTGDFTIADEE